MRGGRDRGEMEIVRGEREERGKREGGEREERGRREGGEREERGRREGGESD